MAGLTFSKEITLSSLIQAIVIIATAAAFWAGLSGRLDVLQTKLEAQGERITDVKRQVDRIEDRIPVPRFPS